MLRIGRCVTARHQVALLSSDRLGLGSVGRSALARLDRLVLEFDVPVSDRLGSGLVAPMREKRPLSQTAPQRC